MSTLLRDLDLRSRRQLGPSERVEESFLGETHPASVAIALQRSVGNHSLARAINRGGGTLAGPKIQRQPATATASTDEELVRGWIAAGETRENNLTDRLFFHRHPDLAGTRLAPGSEEAREWLEIRQTVVRPTLENPAPPAPEPATDDSPATSDTGTSSATSMLDDALTAIGDAADSAVSVGEDLLDDIADAGTDLLDFASESGDAVGDAVLDFFGIGSDGETAPDDLQQPEVIVEVPLEVEPEHQRGDTYKSQRDNESAHVGGDASCSPTSFTMALIDLHGGDEEVVRSRTTALIEERGGSTDYSQTEELVIELLEIVDWEQATKDKPAYFWSPKKWASWAKNKYGGHYYKDPNAQQYVASLYSATGGDKAETYSKLYTRESWAPVVTAMREGAYATAQGAFTSSGHVVNIVDADDDGVTINDPFGLWLRKAKGYGLSNGSKGGQLGEAAKAEFDRRSTKNPALVQTYESYLSESPPDSGYGAWGERNFYSWDDVEDVKLGKWVSVLRAG